MNILPLNDKQLQELFKKKYAINKTVLNNKTAKLNIVTNQKADSITTVTTNIELQYSLKNYLPAQMQMRLLMRLLLSPIPLPEPCARQAHSSPMRA